MFDWLKKINRRAIVWSVIIILVIILIGAIDVPSIEELGSNGKVSRIENTSQTIPTVVKGIGFTRSQLIEALQKPEMGEFIFKQRENNPEAYIGIGDTENGVEFIGPENNLKEAKVWAVFSSVSAEKNSLSIATIMAFANLIDQNSVEWVMSEIAEASENPKNPYTNLKVFGTRKFNIYYNPQSLPTLTLSIIPAN